MVVKMEPNKNKPEMNDSAALEAMADALLAEALRQKAPELAPDFARFTRLETYDANMEIYR